MAEFLPYVAELRDKAAASGHEVLLCGDWTSRTGRRTSRHGRRIGATPGSCRTSGPGSAGSSTRSATSTSSAACIPTHPVRTVFTRPPSPTASPVWWSFRGKAFDNDAGWRIDYQVATPGLAERAVSAVAQRAASYSARWSDHAPVTIRHDWP